MSSLIHKGRNFYYGGQTDERAVIVIQTGIQTDIFLP